jgi:hypothetical protein
MLTDQKIVPVIAKLESFRAVRRPAGQGGTIMADAAASSSDDVFAHPFRHPDPAAGVSRWRRQKRVREAFHGTGQKTLTITFFQHDAWDFVKDTDTL